MPNRLSDMPPEFPATVVLILREELGRAGIEHADLTDRELFRQAALGGLFPSASTEAFRRIVEGYRP